MNYMKIIKKLKWFFLVILIGVIGAWLNENFVHYYTPKGVFYSILISGIALAVITYLLKPTRKYKFHLLLLSLTIGFLLIPYLGLVIGHSDIFVKDQAGIQAKEVRFKIVKIEFKKEGEDIWETNLANKEATLYPGKNWVWLGRQELSAFGHDRERGVSEIETDIFWDQNIILQEYPDWQVPTPENNPECIKSVDLGGGKYLITFFQRPEFDQPMPKLEGREPAPFPIYPDVGWEVIVGEDGRIERTALHILFPVPFGEKIIEKGSR